MEKYVNVKVENENPTTNIKKEEEKNKFIFLSDSESD